MSHLFKQKLGITSELPSRLLITPHHLIKQFLLLLLTPLPSQDQTPQEDGSILSHHAGKGDRSHLRQGRL